MLKKLTRKVKPFLPGSRRVRKVKPFLPGSRAVKKVKPFLPSRRRVRKVRRGKISVNKKHAVRRAKRSSKAIKKNKILPAATSTRVFTPLLIDFFSAADGVYSSYWVGKFITTLLQRGKKKIISKHMYRAFSILKYTFLTNPLIVLLETLDKIKPNFRLRNYIVRRVIIKEYPIVTLRPRQYILAVHWLASEVQDDSVQFGSSLTTKIAAKLTDFRSNPKRNTLSKKRLEYTKRIVAGQFNIRYSWK